MIQGTYYKEWSSVLNREMEFKVYGSAGVPVLALPARGGRFYDWENNGMPDAIAPLLNEGKVQLFCADSIDGEAVLNGDIPVRRRAEMEEKYFVYLTAELAPRVLALKGAAKDAKLWCVGIDLGAAFPASTIWPASGAVKPTIWCCAALPCSIWPRTASPTSWLWPRPRRTA